MSPLDDQFDGFEIPHDDEASSDDELEADEPVFEEDMPNEEPPRSNGVSPLVIGQAFVGVVLAIIALAFLAVCILQNIAPHAAESRSYGMFEAILYVIAFGSPAYLLLRGAFRRKRV